jgi:hypothetical protein
MKAFTELSKMFAAFSSVIGKNPLLVNSFMGGSLCLTSDAIAQRMEQRDFDTNFSTSRMLSAGLIGSFFGGIVYPRAYARLDTIWHGKDLASLFKKSMVEILTVGVFVNSVSISSRGVFAGRKPNSVVRHVAQEMPHVMLNDARVWLPYNMLAFSFIPAYIRPTATAFMEASWQTYISLRSHDYETNDDSDKSALVL